VFLSDGSDVTVTKDPSHIIKKDYDLFVCEDSILLSEFPYIEFHRQVDWGDYVMFLLSQNKWSLINMGVIGGDYKNIVNFLDKYCETRTRLGRPELGTVDMWLGQYVFRSLLKDKKIMIGEPFTSKFKKYENHRKDVYFIHK
jgi:hypothetical protein